MILPKNIKILCLIIAFVLFFSSVPAGAAHIFKDIPESDPLYNIVQELNALGIVIGNPNIEYSPETAVTRGELALILERYLGLQDSRNFVTGFEDVPVSDKAYHAIGVLVGMGYMSPVKGNRFMPDLNLTLEEVLTILLNIMGYKPIAEAKGYINVATDINLLKGMKLNSNHISRRDIAVLIYNSLDTSTMSVNGINPNGSVVLVRDVPVLEKFRDIVFVGGIIDSTEVSSLMNSDGCKEEHVSIGDTLFKVGNSNANRLLGCRVKLYYHQTKSGEKTAIAAIAREDRNIVTRILDKNIVSVDFSQNGSVSYYDAKNNIKTVRLAPIPAVLYNGVANLSWNYNKNTFKGYIEFIDNNTDGRADVVSVWEYINVRVSSVNISDKSIFGSFYENNGAGIYTYKADNFILQHNNKGYQDVYKDGADVQFSDIRPDQMISLFMSGTREGSKYSMIYISDTVIKGTVDEISDDEIIVSGAPVKVDPAFAGDSGIRYASLRLGTSTTIYIDSFDKAADVDLDNTSSPTGVKYGLIIKMGTTQYLSGELAFKIFGQDSKMHVLYVAERIELNGIWTNITKPNNVDILDRGHPILSIFCSTNLPYLIRYRVNANGKIDFIDTPSSKADWIISPEASDREALTEGVVPAGAPAYGTSMSSTNLASYRSGIFFPYYTNYPSMPMNLTFPDDTTTITFMLAFKAERDDSDYSIVRSSRLGSDGQYYLKTYTVSDVGVPRVMVVMDINDRDTSSVKYGTFSNNLNYGGYAGFLQSTVLWGQIKEIKQGLNSEGTAALKMTIVTQGAPKDYIFANSASPIELTRTTIAGNTEPKIPPSPITVNNLSVGDIVRFRLNGKGEIYAIYPDVKIMTTNGFKNAIVTAPFDSNVNYMYSNVGHSSMYYNYADSCYGFVYAKDTVNSKISVATTVSEGEATSPWGPTPKDCMAFTNMETSPRRNIPTSSSTKVSIYDKKGKVKTGTMADVKDYKNYGKPSLVYVKFMNAAVTEVFIFDLDR